MQRAQIITINNQKGGVGKTTAIMSTSSILAKGGKKVLAIDAESQNNLTTGFMTFDQISKQRRFFFDAINACVTGEGSTELPIVSISSHLDLVPSSRDMAGVESVMSTLKSGHLQVFRELIRPYLRQYDFIFFDIPPTPGLVTLNTYMAVDFLFIIARLEDDSYDGAVNMLRDIHEYVNPRRNPPLTVNGVFFNEYDQLPLIHRSIKKNFEDTFGGTMMASAIRRNTSVKAAKRAHKGVYDYDPSCNAAKDYLALTEEIIGRIEAIPTEILNKY